MKSAITIGIISVVFTVACSSSSDDNTIPEGDQDPLLSGLESCVQTDSTQALLCGTAFAADGVTPLIGAEITLAEDVSNPSGSSIATARGVASTDQCLTDSQGEYSCIMPQDAVGITQFELTADGFESQIFEVNIQAGQVSTAQPQVLESNSTVQWAVVPGDYDGVQVLLAQLKGCTLNDASGNPWNSSNPDSYDARGSADCESKGLRVLEANERAFYTDGSLDQFDALFINCDADLSEDEEINTAIRNFNTNGNHVYFSDLSDYWLDAAFPDQIQFAGNSTQVDSNFEATVVDENLAAVVGSSVNLVFDFPGWSAIDTVSDNSTVYIEADLSSLSDYQGIKPITVGFKPEDSDACVFFTSYHIEAASSGSDQELAIKYLVQNIDTVCA